MITSEEAYKCVQYGFPYASGFTMLVSAIFGVIALVLRGFLKWYEELKLKEKTLREKHEQEIVSTH